MAKRRKNIKDRTIISFPGRNHEELILLSSLPRDIISSPKRNHEEVILPSSLPKDIIFNILVRLPAEFLHSHGKRVCRAWADIIRDPVFIEKHLLHANPGLLVYDFCLKSFCFFKIEGGKGEMTNLNRDLRGSMLNSCEGILLLYHRECERLLVANIVTMRVLELHFPSAVLFSFCDSSSIAYISQTGKFKVICPSKDLDGTCGWFIQTIGVDVSWRKIEDFVTLESWMTYVNRNPKSIGGVVYSPPGTPVEGDEFCKILAIDLHDECIHYLRPPREGIGKGGKGEIAQYEIMEIENDLSCLIWSGDSEEVVEVEIYILEDLRRNEWAKAFKLGAEIERQMFCHRFRVPVYWLDDGQVLVTWFVRRIDETVVEACNVKTGAMKRINSRCTDDQPQQHIISLLSW